MNVGGELVAVVTAIVAVITVLVRIVERLVLNILNRNKEEEGTPLTGTILTTTSQQQIKEIHNMQCRLFDMHTKYDNDGMPLWYYPRSTKEENKEILVLQRSVLEKITEITHIQERIVKLLDKLETKIDATVH